MPSRKISAEDPLKGVDPSRRAFVRRLLTSAFVAPLVTTYALARAPQTVQESNPQKGFPDFRRTPTPTPTKRIHS